jgi:carbon-monoxide dehydrogenase medium subunit
MAFDFHEPATLAAVVELLAQHGPRAALLAGGTALLVDIRHGERQPAHVVSLWAVPGLAGVRRNGGLHIGACTTVTALARAVGDDLALAGLREACWLLGARQVQNVATVGGNLCKASPGADLVPPLLCLDAELHLASPAGERRTPLDGFLTGPDQTALRPAEVLTAIALPPIPLRTGTAFAKVMRRHAVDCSIVAVAARVTLAADGRTAETVRVAVGAAAPNPFRATAAEQAVQGTALEPAALLAAAQAARSQARPISDVRASASYRSRLVASLTERALRSAAERAARAGVSQ